jgi:hypothetical protein
MAEVLIPLLLKERPMLLDQPYQRGELRTSEPDVRGQRYGHEPKLGVSLCLFNMNVRRLLPLVAEEKEAESCDAEDGRHAGNLPATAGSRQS